MMGPGVAETRQLDDEARIRYAVAVLQSRLRRLPKDDANDVLELVRALTVAATDAEREDLVEAMLEILEQTPTGVERLPQSGEAAARPEGLRRWIDFASRKVHDARKKAGLTQEELAEKSGLQQSHISRIENGKHSPSPYTLEKIATALGIPVGEFDPSH